MIAPAAGFIEMAQERIKNPEYMNKNNRILHAQDKEVRSALPNLTEAEYQMYHIGIETARVLLEGMLSAVKAKVTI